MKLLFDHNLSPRLVQKFADLCPDSQHLFSIEMDSAQPTLRERDEDEAIWEYALQQNYTIATRDSDYNDFSLIRGFPPKVIWIRRGNCSTHEIEDIFQELAAYRE